MILGRNQNHYHYIEELSHHVAAVTQETHVQVTEQVNVGVKSLVIMPVVWMESLSSIDYILIGEWRREYGVQESFLEDKEKSHKAGLGK